MPTGPGSEVSRYQAVDLDSLAPVNPRSVGMEHAAPAALRHCGWEDKLCHSRLAALIVVLAARFSG